MGRSRGLRRKQKKPRALKWLTAIAQTHVEANGVGTLQVLCRTTTSDMSSPLSRSEDFAFRKIYYNINSHPSACQYQIYMVTHGHVMLCVKDA